MTPYNGPRPLPASQLEREAAATFHAKVERIKWELKIYPSTPPNVVIDHACVALGIRPLGPPELRVNAVLNKMGIPASGLPTTPAWMWRPQPAVPMPLQPNRPPQPAVLSRPPPPQAPPCIAMAPPLMMHFIPPPQRLPLYGAAVPINGAAVPINPPPRPPPPPPPPPQKLLLQLPSPLQQVAVTGVWIDSAPSPSAAPPTPPARPAATDDLTSEDDVSYPSEVDLLSYYSSEEEGGEEEDDDDDDLLSYFIRREWERMRTKLAFKRGKAQRQESAQARLRIEMELAAKRAERSFNEEKWAAAQERRNAAAGGAMIVADLATVPPQIIVPRDAAYSATMSPAFVEFEPATQTETKSKAKKGKPKKKNGK